MREQGGPSNRLQNSSLKEIFKQIITEEFILIINRETNTNAAEVYKYLFFDKFRSEL